MALVKGTLTGVLFYIVYSYDFLWYPAVAGIVKLITCLSVAWFISRRVTRHVICKKLLPRVDPTGKAVLITGCDMGFGFATALQLNRAGFFVFAGCLNANSAGARDLVKRAHDASRMLCVQLDVTSDEQVSAALTTVEQVLADHQRDVGQLYAVINNAGIAAPTLVEFGGKGSQETYEMHLQVNTFGTIRVTRAFLPLLRRAKKARVVNVSSMAARANLVAMNPYAVSKAATSKFTEGLQDELTEFGITSIGVEPWFFRTRITDPEHLGQGMQRAFDASSDEVRSAYVDKFKSAHHFLGLFLNSPFIVCEDTGLVVETITDAVVSAEPDLVYRVVPPLNGPFVWLVTDIVPWEWVIGTRRIFDLMSRRLTKLE